MAQITAADVAKLREMTNAGMMDCKKALVEAEGDLDKAVEILRKKGVAAAAKKGSREATEGIIVQHVQPGGRVGVLVEVNCQTDFVARNEMFRAFAAEVAETLAANPNATYADFEAKRVELVSKTGENIKIARHHRMEVSGNGLVAAYIHLGDKIGVLVEVGSGKPETVNHDAFKQLVRDITLQIAAASPQVVSREDIPKEVLDKEREIAAEQFKNKPPQALAKIVEGKLEKFYQSYCLLDQGFVKRNSEVSVKDHIASVAKEVGDEITVRRFVRFRVGEASS